MHYNITIYTVNLFNAWACNLWKWYKHIISHIVIFQPIYIVAKLIALHSWLLLWLVAYFDPLFQVLKQLIKVQERTFCCNSTDSFTLKDCRIAAIFMQHNTDDLTMFISYVTSTHDKFPIPLHWLYIYAYMYTKTEIQLQYLHAL